jgi:hypothetical protein
VFDIMIYCAFEDGIAIGGLFNSGKGYFKIKD